MSKINELNINITKALITEIWIDLSNLETPKYTIQGALTTDQGRKVSNFTFWSNSYGEEMKVEIPVNVHMHAAEIFKAMKPIIYEKLNDIYPKIAYVAESAQEVSEEDKTSEADIPF